jgi:hypothetical protein
MVFYQTENPDKSQLPQNYTPKHRIFKSGTFLA